MKVHNIKRNSRAASRSGVTLLEVMFAIFVVVVGLLGIASILPLAARNASDSNAHNNAQALGQRWFQSFFAQRLNEHDAFTSSQLGYDWYWYRDYAPAPTGAATRFERLEKAYTDPAARVRIGIPPGLNQSPTNSLINNGVTAARVWGHQAVCIDPLFFTEPDVRQVTANGLPGRNLGYRLAVFPYFEDGYNPITDPFAPGLEWPDQPRMLRVTLGTGPAAQVSRKMVEDIFASPDDIAIDADPKDKTLPPYRLFDSSYSKGLASGQYSWLATLSPREPLAINPTTAISTSTDYLISLVVMNRRDRQYLAPGATFLPGNAQDKPGGERLVWVAPLSGNFTGGNGGRVRLIGNAATSDVVHTGDWIMLGKHYMIDPSDTSRRYAYFRWYRIIAVDQQTQVGPLSNISPSGDPFGLGETQPVWSRDVVLEGPNFDLTSSPGGFVAPVTGTLMGGVVTVVERNLSIE